MKVTVFDAYGTLINLNALEEPLQHHFGVDADQVGLTWRQKQLQYTWLRTLMNHYCPFSQVTEEALVYACQRHRVDLPPEAQHDLLNCYRTLPVYPDVPSVLSTYAQLRSLAILSNADADLLTAAVDHNQIESLFSGAKCRYGAAVQAVSRCLPVSPRSLPSR